MNKDKDRDLAAGRALTLWMKANGYSDSRLAREIQRSTPAVATWRKGTRPMPRERAWLEQKLGWNWDTPPGEDYVPSTVNVEVPPAPVPGVAAAPPKTIRRRAAKAAEAPAAEAKAEAAPKARAKARRPEAAAAITEKMLEPGSIEGLLLARTVIGEHRPLDPANPTDSIALSVFADLVEAEVTRRGKSNRTVREVIEVRQLVLGHRNPAECLAFLRAHTKYSAEVLDMAARSLPGTEASAPAMAEA